LLPMGVCARRKKPTEAAPAWLLAGVCDHGKK
jgi:hypothetical protein